MTMNSHGQVSSIVKFAFLFAFFCLFIIASSYGTYVFFSSLLTHHTEKDLLGLAKIKANQIEMLLSEMHRNADIFVARPSVWRTLSGINLSGEAPRLDLALTDTMNYQEYRRIIIVDASFHIIAPANAASLTPMVLLALQKSVRNNDYAIVDVHQSSDGVVVYGLVHAVFANNDKSGAAVGAAYLERASQKDLFPILDLKLTSNPSAITILARRDGDEIVFLNRTNLTQEMTPLSRSPISGHSQTLAVKALVGGERGLISGFDFRGVDVIGAAIPVNGTNWMMIRKIDRSDVLHPAMLLGWAVFTVTLTLLLLLTSSFYLFWRKRSHEFALAHITATERHAIALRTSIDGFLLVDKTGKIIESNAALSRILGHSEAELKTLSIQDLAADQSSVHIAATLMLVAGHFTTSWRHKNETVVDLETSTSFAGDYIFIFIKDITERKRLESHLQNERTNVLNILWATDVGSWEWNVQTGESRFNERWADIAGYTLEELSPITIDTWMNLAHPDDLVHSAKLLHQHFSGELDHYECEARMRHKDGQWIWVLDRGKVISRTNDGQPLWMAGSHADITERKQSESLLAKRNVQLEEAKLLADRANLSKTQFLASASHDLRQPLQALVLYLEILSGHQSKPEAHKLVGKIEDSLDALGEFLNELLDISKLDAGAIMPKIKAFSLHALLMRIDAELAPMALNKGLIYKTMPTSAFVLSDPFLLGSILRNLLGNAIKYTEKGRVLCGVRHNGQNLRIEVRDTGKGIPKDQMDLIFNDFHQVENINRDRRNGVGLGLSIVKRTAQLLGHKIEVSSILGGGSMFSIMVPMAVGETDVQCLESGADINKVGYLVLAFEDDLDILESLTMLLELRGNRVIAKICNEDMCVSCHEIGATLVSEGLIPDLIISDNGLHKDCSGLTVVQRLREQCGRTIPAIILTGDTGPALLGEAKENGISLVYKPVRPSELEAVIENILQQTTIFC